MGTKVQLTLKNETTKVYQDDQVVSANVFEANDPLCLKLESGQLECILYSPTDEFNILNPNGITDQLAVHQKVVVSYVFPDETEMQIGVYYLNNWTFEANNQLRIICEDGISLLDQTNIRNIGFDIQTSGGVTYIYRPLGTIFYACRITDNRNVIANNLRGQRPYALENTTTFRCIYPPIVSCRELVSNILAQSSCSIIMKPNGIPYLFESSETPWGNQMPRPEASEPILTNRIILASSSYEIPEKIGKVYTDLYLDYNKDSLQEIYKESVTAGSGTRRVDLDSGYTDYEYSAGITSFSYTQGHFSFRYNVSTNTTLSVSAKGINNLYKTNVKTYSSDEKSTDVEIKNTLMSSEPLDLWFERWNDGFITNVQFLMNENLEERAGTKIQIELEPNKLYTAVIMELNIDVTGGMIADAKILCMKNYEVINND